MGFVKPLFFGAAVSMLVSVNAHAAASERTIFSCQTASGKVVDISNAGEAIRYTYGRSNAAADLNFMVPRSATSIHDGADDMGSGSWTMVSEVTLRFNGVTYTGWWSFNRSNQEEAGGIRVARGTKILAETPCKSEVTMNLAAYRH
jgi:hypothetical protein